jgi:hypothetical protein
MTVETTRAARTFARRARLCSSSRARRADNVRVIIAQIFVDSDFVSELDWSTLRGLKGSSHGKEVHEEEGRQEVDEEEGDEEVHSPPLVDRVSCA